MVRIRIKFIGDVSMHQNVHDETFNITNIKQTNEQNKQTSKTTLQDSIFSRPR